MSGIEIQIDGLFGKLQHASYHMKPHVHGAAAGHCGNIADAPGERAKQGT
jgi:hypothetical protein